MAVILSVSINKEQEDFLNETKMSPSELLQRSINDEMARSRITGAQLKEANSKVQRLIETIQKQMEFIDNKGLLEEYNELV